MPASKVVDFFLNTSKESKEGQVVEAPAFSLTKVMIVLAPLVTTIVTLVTDKVGKTDFSSGEVTAMIVALLALLALTSAADVLARGIATSAEKSAAGAKAAAEARTQVIPLNPTVAGQLVKDGPDEDVKIVAMSNASPPEFLVLRADDTLSWHPVSSVTL
ncbi:hypothetical protein EFK50_15990 [Nocardioides marmoriginsengisoli]|uniref:Uncharacterized protein n=1 Tax=Nocardioides marmoriginsengisoli TaxID=661483 RepID=A0A3N0CI93_9ACTN|nr:hypothetical protein [Nocardioides marmoriginsengisoli]RNL63198.1 hypothetical protein EFK50_15990 [Nocardioides marmoriginsengisoli]